MIRQAPSKWGPIALVCKKCGKKLDGGFGKKNKHALAKTLHDTLKQSGRRRALRVVESPCLGICPKGTVAVALSDRILLVPPGTPVEDVIQAIAPPPVAPAPPAPETAPAPPPGSAHPPVRTD